MAISFKTYFSVHIRFNCAFITKNPVKIKMKAKLISENIVKIYLNKTFYSFIYKNE